MHRREDHSATLERLAPTDSELHAAVGLRKTLSDAVMINQQHAPAWSTMHFWSSGWMRHGLPLRKNDAMGLASSFFL